MLAGRGGSLCSDSQGWVQGGLGSQSWAWPGGQWAAPRAQGQADPSSGAGQRPGAQPPSRVPLTLPISLQLQLEKHKGEILGVVVVESGWGSILPTVILANMMNGGPAARSGKLSIGDQIMSINGTSLVGLPLATCQGIIKVGARSHSLLYPCCLENSTDP